MCTYYNANKRKTQKNNMHYSFKKMNYSFYWEMCVLKRELARTYFRLM